MKSLTKKFALAAALFLAATSTQAMAANTYNVDESHSMVTFRVKHLNVAYFHGRFNKVSGKIAFDDADHGKSSIEIEVPVASIDTKDEKRDGHLKSPDFFNAREFPTMSFKSKKIEAGKDDMLNVKGDLTLHGVTKPVTVQIERTGSGADPWGGKRTGFETTFTIKRTDYGMDKMLDGIGDEVRVTVAIEGVNKG